MIRPPKPLVVFVSAAALGLGACSGASPGPKHPDDDPSLVEPRPDEAAAASSAKVQAGIDAIQAGDFDKARQVLAEAHAENPKDAQAPFYLGVALEQSKDLPGAIEHYKKALALDPKLIEASQNLSAILLESGDAAGALRVAEGGLQHAPKHPELLLNRALTLEETGDKDGALAAYGAAASVQPDNLELAYAYAEHLAAAGKKEPALAQLKKVTLSDDPQVLAAAANVFGQLKAFGECIAALDKAIGKVGKNKQAATLHVRRGVCRHELKDDAGAKSDYDAALALDADFAPVHYYLGMHHRAAGKKKEAIAAFQRAAKLAGDQGVGPGARKALEELGAKPN
jgi:tetratricopeptide (TPR) repeat protein